MGVLREKMGEVVPFTLMVIMEGCTIGLTILAKTAITGGMSPFVFVVYTNVIGSLLLLPFSFIFHRERTEQSLLTFPLLVRIFFLGLTGRTRPNWRSSSSQAEVTGTLISIMGAVVVELYKGPFIRKSSYFYAHQLKVIPKRLVFYSAPDNWILGAILLAAASLSVAIWNVIQLGTVKQYPQVMKVASFYSLAGTIQCLVFSLIMERDLNAWKLKLNLELLLIVVTGVFGSIIRSNVHLACSRMKGPFYVPMFKPFGIVFATFFGVTFTNSLHYGSFHFIPKVPASWSSNFLQISKSYSVIGTLITGMGYYAVMWGQIREEELRKERDVERTDDSSDQIKAPLLQKQEEAQV
ncbi:WAT1-related protein At1g70260 isoform X3 [Herrania umbratica]|uniref:WAT1-related protein At1g70260 isoform X3 n=1 Tax=Herrania umbratica TaxID=108875 RepID=A0A6J1B1E7_9ROSI|nr:WAT1-related protein At1g70260 isoform X3 [Herrania umbratica]